MIIKTKFHYIFFTCLFLIFSCSSKHSKNSDINNDNTVKIDFPEIVLKQEMIKGKIKYDLSLDSIKDKDIDNRYIFLYLTKIDTISSLEEVKKHPHKVFVEGKEKGIIEFKVNFEVSGRKVLNFFIEDKIFYRKSRIKDSVHIKSKEINFTKGVFVKDIVREPKVRI